jgi:signal transduction histidine kinase
VFASAAPSVAIVVALSSIVYLRVRAQRLADLDQRLAAHATNLATYVEYDGGWELEEIPDVVTEPLAGFEIRSEGSVLRSEGALVGRTWSGVRAIESEGEGPDVVDVAVAVDPAPVTAELHTLLGELVVVGSALGLAAVGMGLVLSRRIVSSDEYGRLQAAWERQAAFTADASHELRTPLTVIRTAAEVALRRDRSHAEYEEALRDVVSSAARMEGLIEGLLVLARSDERIQGETVDLSAVVREVAGDMPAPAGVAVHLEIPDGARTTGDRRLLGVVVRNLIGNALRHTRSGSVDVQLDRARDDWRLVVADTGEGIAPEHLPHVFDRFYRGDAARSADRGGAGLGLAVVRAIVERHGGRVAIASEVGRGTTVTVSLPAN